MINLIIRYRILKNLGSGFVAGNYLEVYWDDVANDFLVYKYANSSLTSPTTITSGPDLGSDRTDHERMTASRPIPYSFCDGADLQSFEARPSVFPYARKISTPNHFSCVSAVCDLSFSDVYNIVDSTGIENNDGAISVRATSSQGFIRYSLNADFDYAAGQGQDNGNFLDLYPGDYTITAKDPLGCVAQITLTVGIPETYAVRYRLEFTDLFERQCRTDIEERGYTGEIEDVCGSDDPVIIRYNGDGELDKFTPVIPSELELTLIAQSNFKFRHLFTQDERKYRIKHYTDYGNTIDATPEIPGDTVPLNLDGLANWGQIMTMSNHSNWAAGSGTQTVTFSPSTMYIGPVPFQVITPSSSRLYTNYPFVPGYDYDITLYFDTNGTNNLTLSIRDAFGVVQFSQPYSFTPGSHLVNISFTATAECKSVNVIVSNSKTAVSYVTLTNITGTVTSPTIPATSGGPAGLELIWQGFVISSNYQEAYIAPPYPVTVVATDGLADLKNYDFADPLDNLYTEDITPLKAITDLLLRTDLGCNFISGINKYEENMASGAGDDPLSQCRFDPNTFYQGNNITDALTALGEILKPFGAILKMRHGKFFAYIMEQAVDGIPVREFSSRGVFLKSGIIDDTQDINFPIIESGALFRNRDQVLEILPTYGRFYFEHKLIKTPSLIKSYSFENSDVYQDTDGTNLFRNWNVNIGSSPGAEYGIKETQSFEGSFNFFYRPYYVKKVTPPLVTYEHPVTMDTVPVRYQILYLTSQETLIEYTGQDLIEVKFDYAAIPDFAGRRRNPSANPWVRLKWSLRIGNLYMDSSGGWTDDGAYKYNEVYVDEFAESKSFKLLTALPPGEDVVTETMSIEFAMETRWSYDYINDEYATFNVLKAIPTVGLPVGKRVRGVTTVRNPSDTQNRKYDAVFVLEEEEINAGPDHPEFIRPNDYHASTNRKIWKNLNEWRVYNDGGGFYERMDAGGTPELVEYWYLDNVVIKHYPNGSHPPDNITIERINNRNIKVDFHGEYLLNDIDTDNINNSERIYINYFKLLSGAPTQVWERTYRPGNGKLMTLLSSEFVSQYQSPANKLTGSILCRDEILPSTVLREVNDGNKKYMFMGYELHAKESTIAFDLAQIKDVVTDDESEDVDAGFTTGFSLGFRA